MPIRLGQKATEAQSKATMQVSKLPFLGSAIDVAVGSTPQEQINSLLAGGIGMARVQGVPFVKFKKSFQNILGKLDKLQKFPSKESDVILREAAGDVGGDLETFISNFSGKDPSRILKNLTRTREFRDIKMLEKAGITGSDQVASQLKALKVTLPKQFQRFNEILNGELTKFIDKTLIKVVE